MTKPDFVYTTYIKTTPEKLWSALTTPEFNRQYWGPGIVSDWKKGATWQIASDEAGSSVHVAGEVLESRPPHRLALSWFDPSNPEDDSKVTFTIDTVDDMVRLTVIHGDFKSGSKMATGIALGWPRVLSSMKSFLETGKALNTWAGDDHGCTNPR